MFTRLLSRISHHGGADIPVCPCNTGTRGKQTCLPHRTSCGRVAPFGNEFRPGRLVGPLVLLVLCTFLPQALLAQKPAEPIAKQSVLFKVQNSNERLEMTVHTSRILAMEQKIPQAQVNNPDILELTPLSPTQIQVSAKAAGVTQINLWGEDQKVSTIDVIVFGDARELTMVLRSAFPNAALKVVPVANSVMISGFVDQPEHVERIVRIAEEYYPKVINNMAVGGCQQVLLHVKVMEVSRTKLRRLGFDWGKVTGSNVVTSSPIGLVTDYVPGTYYNPPQSPWRSGSASTFAFNVVNGSSAFYGVLDTMRRDNLLKIMAEPTLVTVNGRPAMFNSGGEFPLPIAQSLGTVTAEWKKYGTQVDFVPIVLGNGKVRLEVHPRISERDDANGATIGTTFVPAIKSREADTGVELSAGESLAIAGLVQSRQESENRGLPWISDLPYIGAAFRRVEEVCNEVELLILVTPELVEGMAANEVPECGPGMQTTSPSDWELFMKGHLEVPKCCPNPCANGECQQNGNCPDGPPSDGMILRPEENIPTPSPSGRPARTSRTAPDAAGQSPDGSGPSATQNRYTRARANTPPAGASAGSDNTPPGLSGPVGYDVVK
jgi:pilus assembly protein CpaC